MKTMTKAGKPTRAYLGLIDVLQLALLRLALTEFKKTKTAASQRELNRVSALIAGYQEDLVQGAMDYPTTKRFLCELRNGARVSPRRGRTRRPRSRARK